MSVHIGAKTGEIARIVLLAGDPLRAKHIAETMLTDIKLVSTIRNAFYFTGNYKGVSVTVGASGMGCASIGIYSYELYNEYNVDCIIRIGTAGAYTEKLRVYDVLNVERAYSESTYAISAFNYEGDNFLHQGKAYELINECADQLGMPIVKANIHSSDVFYRAPDASPKVAIENNCVAVEMEAFALFANAKYLNKIAGTILTISDIIPTHEAISAEHRQSSLNKMMNLALESVVLIDGYLNSKV